MSRFAWCARSRAKWAFPAYYQIHLRVQRGARADRERIVAQRGLARGGLHRPEPPQSPLQATDRNHPPACMPGRSPATRRRRAWIRAFRTSPRSRTWHYATKDVQETARRAGLAWAETLPASPRTSPSAPEPSRAPRHLCRTPLAVRGRTPIPPSTIARARVSCSRTWSGSRAGTSGWGRIAITGKRAPLASGPSVRSGSTVIPSPTGSSRASSSRAGT